MTTKAAVWLRRDLRWHDHPPLFHATRDFTEVIPFFVIDERVLEEFSPGLKPSAYFFSCLLNLREEFRKQGSDIILLKGDPAELVPKLCWETGSSALYLSSDYEPDNIARDQKVFAQCQVLGIQIKTFKSHVIFEKQEILNLSGEPYKVYSAYRKSYVKKMSQLKPETMGEPIWKSLQQPTRPKLLTARQENMFWAELQKKVADGGKEFALSPPEPGEKGAHQRLTDFIDNGLSNYSAGRNLPAEEGTSRLSFDLRAGTISPTQIWKSIQAVSDVKKTEKDIFLSELIWRDFFVMVGFCFPHVFTGPFNRRYEKIRWRNRPEEFEAWCQGRTGYPIVDAGMRELVATGFMHNRVRMITAMFLVKDLLVDWRWGEKFFRQHLMDADLAVNNGNWQWCASTGCDAQPYFRIFNPTLQGKKFDPDGVYIKKHVPELRGLTRREIHEPHLKAKTSPQGYPLPIVDHSFARMRCLIAYTPMGKKAKTKAE